MGTLSDFEDLQVRALERSSYFQKVITSTRVQKVNFGNKCINYQVRPCDTLTACWNSLALNEVFLFLSL
jgi:hypothetical protein